MIPLIPVAVIVGALMVGIIIYAGQTMMEVQELQDQASRNTQERLQEKLHGEYEGSPTSISQVRLFNQWTDESRIIGIMVTCSDGTVHTKDIGDTIPGGQGISLDPHIPAMQAMAGRCP